MLYAILKFILNFIINFFKKNKQLIVKIPSETQYEKSCKKYANFYSIKTDDENSNIDAVLYDFDKRKEVFTETKNTQEQMWKSRILFENTPRGNVMMYYNPYTMSFYYHSDEQIIPYKILEEVSKKYVVMNRCKDFFIDMKDRPDNKMIDILQKEEDSLKSKKMKVSDITKCVNAHSDSKDVFAALKDYRSLDKTVSSTPSVPSSTLMLKKTAAAPDVKFSNKFVRIGKMCEFNILQKPPNDKIVAVNELMFGGKPVNKVVDFFDDNENDDDDDDLEIREIAVSSYKKFKLEQKSS